MSEVQPSQWWHPDRHADRRPILLARNRIEAGLRLYFANADFVGVDVPALQVSPGNETHLHAFATDMIGNDGLPQRRYLHTSPEFTAKKLLAAGERRIFSFGHVWRNRERGPLHHPEFTMVEWYRAGEPYARLFEDCCAIMQMAADAAGVTAFSWRGIGCDPFAEPERLSVADAFFRHAGIDLLATIAPDGTTDRNRLAEGLERAAIGYSADDNWSDLFTRVLVERIEPHLGHQRPTFLDRYPAPEAALARRDAGDPRVSERFELYVCGVELANGFGELTDPVEQRLRFSADMAEKQRIYGETYPLDEDFLAALSFMPEASGIALGFERLVILATGARRIEDVLWAPVAE
ncbi:EF-P lysine aminoacylase EpmA [Martelella sp. HB161492]|uniref:EF-P lysine aminoacylase EpmA n=1 Tax=Martelella sp. HB161492 TaxID=2720726 RepID=UPI001591DE06|nr:EF-P lysine aminoacylase EpmA [Martelella sp. HB161492]